MCERQQSSRATIAWNTETSIDRTRKTSRLFRTYRNIYGYDASFVGFDKHVLSDHQDTGIYKHPFEHCSICKRILLPLHAPLPVYLPVVGDADDWAWLSREQEFQSTTPSAVYGIRPSLPIIIVRFFCF